MASSIKVAHLSDLHFCAWDFRLSHVFSKSLLGNLNSMLGRRSFFDHQRLTSLPSFLKSLDVSTVFITGDISTTSSPAEFEKGKQFASDLEKEGMDVMVIPGNHDQYTPYAYRSRLFYNYFKDQWSSEFPISLKKEGLTLKKISSKWWIMGIDTAIATPWFQSTGYFHPLTEQTLTQILSTIPSNDYILLGNHFPFFKMEPKRKQLVRSEFLKKIIETHPQIKIYCHGHTHRFCQADLRRSGLPLILDTGSTPAKIDGGWNLMEISDTSVKVQNYKWDLEEWNLKESSIYEMVPERS